MVSDIKNKLEMAGSEELESDVDITDDEDTRSGPESNNVAIKEESEENCQPEANTLFIPLGITVNS